MVTQQGPGFVVWLTGMNRAGKSTLASMVAGRLAAAGRTAVLLDEDGDAGVLLDGLGTSREDRAKATARLGFAAGCAMRAGGVAVCASLSPWREPREELRRTLRRFVEVFVDCDMAVLQKRDGSGLYRKALAGEVKDVPGIDVPYEPPARPDLVLRTDQEDAEASATRVFQALVDAKLVGPAEFGRLTGGKKPRRRKRAAGGGAKRRKVDARAAERKAPRKAAARAARPSRARR
jgi:adenylyl-sulfate kinase